MHIHVFVDVEALISVIIDVVIIDVVIIDAMIVDVVKIYVMIIDVVVFDVGQHEMMLMMNLFWSWWTMMSFDAINLDTKGYHNNNNEHSFCIEMHWVKLEFTTNFWIKVKIINHDTNS